MKDRRRKDFVHRTEKTCMVMCWRRDRKRLVKEHTRKQGWRGFRHRRKAPTVQEEDTVNGGCSVLGIGGGGGKKRR